MSYYNSIILKDPDGNYQKIESGDAIEMNDKLLLFKGIEKKITGDYQAVFNKIIDGKISGVFKTGENENFNGYSISDIKNENISGLKISKDPGYVFVILSIIFIMAGLIMNYFIKIREKK